LGQIWAFNNSWVDYFGNNERVDEFLKNVELIRTDLVGVNALSDVFVTPEP
jgi:hypothetical protein